MATKKKTSAAASAKTATPELDAPAGAPGAVASQSQPAQLTVADLQALAQAIDIASRRGAYAAGEMATVGAVYDKLAGFLRVIAEQQRQQQGSAQDGE